MDSYARSFSNILGRPFYFHALRHAYTTYLLEQNLPENVVQTIQGWSSSDMLRIYDDADGIKSVEQSSLEDL